MMSNSDKTPPHIRLDERNHVENHSSTSLTAWAGKSSISTANDSLATPFVEVLLEIS
jgi:hypothetical protein